MNAVKQEDAIAGGVRCIRVGTSDHILGLPQGSTPAERKEAFRKKFGKEPTKHKNTKGLAETVKGTTEGILKKEPVIYSPEEVIQKIIGAQDIHDALLIFNKINTEENKIIIINKIFEYRNKLLSTISEIQHNFNNEIEQRNKIFKLINEKNKILNVLLSILNTTNSKKIKELIIKTELESKNTKKGDYINLLKNLKSEDDSCLDIILGHVINAHYRPILSIKNDSIELDFTEKLIQKYKTLIEKKIQEITIELTRKKSDKKTKEKLLKSYKNSLDSSNNILAELEKEKLEYEKQVNEIECIRKKFKKAKNTANTKYFIKTGYRKFISILLFNKEKKKDYLEKYKIIDREKLDGKIRCIGNANKELERYVGQLKENTQKQESEIMGIENFEGEISRITREIEKIGNAIQEYEAKIDTLKKEKVELAVFECNLR